MFPFGMQDSNPEVVMTIGTRDPSKTCQRCEKMDRLCVFTAPQKRKQRKRTDTRVAELERGKLFDLLAHPYSPKLDSSTIRSGKVIQARQMLTCLSSIRGPGYESFV